MPSFNKITIVGHMGRDPETKYSEGGTAICTFSVATSEKRKDQQETTTWFRVSCFNKTAGFVQQYGGKGALVFVEGRLSMNEYTDRDGKTRTTLEVKADNVQMLGGKGDRAEAATASSPAKAAMSAQTPASAPPTDEDIPF
jgi:single-strand DNA-binding protein